MAFAPLFIPRSESVWAQDPFLISDVPPLASSCLCPIAARLPLTLRVTRHEKAARIQSLWRGYKARKSIQERNETELNAVIPLWKTFDGQYDLYVFCQTLMVELKKDDLSWDATKTHYYTWMMEFGRILAEWETWMCARGWVRPQSRNVKTSMLVRFSEGVLLACGRKKTDPLFPSALARTLHHLGWE
jgi:hypothetical protein